MKKSELKNIIKECVREVIFEEGVLANVVSEVANGLQSAPIIRERVETKKSSSPSRRRVLDEIGNKGFSEVKNKFKDPQLFEGTKPVPSGNSQGSPLSGVDPNDSGVDISNIPGFGTGNRVARKD